MMKRKIYRLSLDPQHIDEDDWYYEGIKGISLYGNLCTGMVIPWGILCASVDRHRRFIKHRCELKSRRIVPAKKGRK